MGWRRFNFRGTIDVLVATRTAIRSLTPQTHMLLLFVLKKNITRSAVHQASVSLLLTNLHSPEIKPALVSLKSCLESMQKVMFHELASVT